MGAVEITILSMIGRLFVRMIHLLPDFVKENPLGVFCIAVALGAIIINKRFKTQIK